MVKRASLNELKLKGEAKPRVIRTRRQAQRAAERVFSEDQTPALFLATPHLPLKEKRAAPFANDRLRNKYGRMLLLRNWKQKGLIQ